MGRVYESEKWNVKFEELGKPLWLILIIVEEEELIHVYFGICQAETKEEAIATVKKPEGAILVEAHNILSVLMQSEMLHEVQDIFDNIDEEE
jgi:hypothetical protein